MQLDRGGIGVAGVGDSGAGMNQVLADILKGWAAAPESGVLGAFLCGWDQALALQESGINLRRTRAMWPPSWQLSYADASRVVGVPLDPQTEVRRRWLILAWEFRTLALIWSYVMEPTRLTASGGEAWPGLEECLRRFIDDAETVAAGGLLQAPLTDIPPITVWDYLLRRMKQHDWAGPISSASGVWNASALKLVQRMTREEPGSIYPASVETRSGN